MIRMTNPDPETQRRDAFRQQAQWCDKLGSPFTALLCRTLADRLDHMSGFGHTVLTWPLMTLRGDLVALRCCGALHYDVRCEPQSGLAKVYPPNPTPEADTLWEAVSATIKAHDEKLTKFLETPPQTNEVSRASVLLGGLLQVAARWRLPLSLIEIGASAGLNLNFDRFAYELGNDRRWGDPQSAVRIKTDWRGHAPPLEAPLQIAARIGNDQYPLSAAREDDRRRLIAYVWPDQSDRLQRLEAALDIAAKHPVEIVKEDAAKFLASCLTRKARDGVARVVFHTIVLQYASAETRAAIKETLAAAGARATATAPLARFSMEHEKPDAPATVRLTLWPGGEERIVGQCDSHGAWVEWMNL
ncbi:MAG: hypothetical protein QOF41_929 [Methylobacteriaceae bacterium]|nr:hypothetical protein [Methylobacteriaceae bacterium]